MEFWQLVQVVGEEPVFETGLLLAGSADPRDVRKQLSRWTAAGRLVQLRRGLYALAPPFQKLKPHPFVIANRMVQGSYVSGLSALAYYDLVPEYVPVTTSVTTGRPRRWETTLGVYEFRHLKRVLFRGYRLLELGNRQSAFVATPEKALLDHIYLEPAAGTPEYLQELRLQNLERLNLDQLRLQAQLFGRPKLLRAVAWIAELTSAQAQEYESV